MLILSRLKPGLQSAYKAATICQSQKLLPLITPKYAFSTDNTNKEPVPFDAETNNLFNVLDKDPTNKDYKTILKVLSSVHKEYKHELSQGSYLPRAETINYLNKHGYTWIEEPGSAKVILQKVSGEYLLELKFQIVNRGEVPLEKEKLELEDLDLDHLLPMQREYVYGEFKKRKFEEEIQKDMEKNHPGPTHYVQLDVLSNNKGGKLYFLLYSEGAQVRCNHIRYFPSEALATGFKGLKLASLPQVYDGVNFHTLSEGFQKLIVKFLEGLGIEAEVFYHIEYLAVNREQRLYMEMLKNIYDFAKSDLAMLKEENEKKNQTSVKEQPKLDS